MTASTPAWSASFVGLGDLPGGDVNSRALAVSADGRVVVGLSVGASGQEAFRWTAETGMVGIGDLAGGSFNSRAAGVSADGNAIAGSSISSKGLEAFLWTNPSAGGAGMEGLGDLPGRGYHSCGSGGVSGDGLIVAGYSSSSFHEAFRWESATGMVGLGDLPGGDDVSESTAISFDGSVIVGYGNSDLGPAEAFRWTKADGMVALGDLPGGSFRSAAAGCSRDGSVIVGDAASASGSEAFRWTEANGMTGLGVLPGGAWVSRATGVSGDGTIVVGWSSAAGGTAAFIWTAGGGLRSLRQELENVHGLDLTGWTLEEATAISDDGSTIVGFGTFNGTEQAWRARLIDEVEVVCPDDPSAFTREYGGAVGGDALDLCASDDVYLEVAQVAPVTPVLPYVRIESWVHTSAADQPVTRLTYTLEGRVSAIVPGGQNPDTLRTFIYNYAVQAFGKPVDVRATGPGVDEVIVYVQAENAGDFVQAGDGEIRIRAEAWNPGNTINALWRLHLDWYEVAVTF